jgi:plastocyanin
VRLVHPLLLGSVLALAATAPAAAAQVEVKGQDSLTWDKPAVTIAAGDTVNWSFPDTTQAHNVKSGSDNWSYQSQIGAPAPNGTFRFDAPGVYRFICQVHPDSMIGNVTVTDAAGTPPPPPPPPPPGSQPFPNDSPPLTVLETGGLDRTRPAVRDLRVRRAARGARIRFRVSERSLVTVRFKRRGKTVKTAHLNASGRARITVRDRRKLRAGRYRIEILARDVAGNQSHLRTAHLTLR